MLLSVAPSLDCEACHFRPDGARLPLTRPPTERLRQLAPSRSASASRRVLSRHLAHHSHCRQPSAPPTPADRRQPPVYPNSSPDHRACTSLTPLPPSSRVPRQRYWQCPSCTIIHERNYYNAAVNLRNLLILSPGRGTMLRNGKALVRYAAGETGPDDRRTGTPAQPATLTVSG